MAIILEEYSRTLPPANATPEEITQWVQREFELLERIVVSQSAALQELEQRIITLEGA